MIESKIDGHVHTRLCHHASGEMEEYVRAALGQGLQGLIFLEHYEVGINYFESTWLSPAEFESYFQEGTRLREKYRGRIAIGLGVEVGYNPARVEETLVFLASRAWERIGISYHFFAEAGVHYNTLSQKQDNLEMFSRIGLERVVDDYFTNLLAAVEVLPGTVLCHLDAVLRHHPDLRFTAAHQELMRRLLRAVAAKGMALEVNTSGYKHRQSPYPHPALIEEALQLGIPLVAGSDAHAPAEVGRYFAQLPNILTKRSLVRPCQPI